MNQSAKLDQLQCVDQRCETTVALYEIQTQLAELTKSVESCHSEVSEVNNGLLAVNSVVNHGFSKVNNSLPEQQLPLFDKQLPP